MIVPFIDLTPLRGKKIEVQGLPSPSECPNGTIYGTYSLKLPNGYRVIDKRRIVQYLDVWDTQTAFTRCWLNGLPQRRSRSNQRDMLLQSRPPQYCRPSVSLHDMAYVDIRSAYLSIYSMLPWGIEYMRGRYWSTDGELIRYPFDPGWKTGRSYVVTGALPGSQRVVMNGKLVERRVPNKHENVSLVCAVWDVLSAIARVAIDRHGARYWNLDGGIFTLPQAERFGAFLQSIDLDYRIKYRGKAKLTSLATWQLGEHETARFSQGGTAHFTDAVPVNRSEADWILRHFRLAAERARVLQYRTAADAA